MDEIQVKQDPDDLLDGRYAVFVQENAEAKEENEQKLFCCSVCDAVLPGSLALFEHLEEHANAMFDDQSDDCTPAANNLGEVGCDLGSTSSESEIERDTRPKAVSEEVSDLRGTPEEVIGFTCDYCSTSFHSKWRLIRHFEWDHKLKSVENIPKKRIGLQTNSSLNELNCKLCSISFSNKWNLNRHFKRFHSDIILKCHHCSKSFIQKYDLKKHLFYRHKFKVNKTDSRNREKRIQKNATAISSTINDGRQQHTCQYCNKTFQSNYYLRQHLERKHKLKTKLVPPTKFLYLSREEIETLVCFYCKGRKFKNKKALQGHIVKVHDIYLRRIFNSKSYICDICSAKFKTKPSMIEHFQRKHNFKVPNVFQSRRFCCELCNLNFSSTTEIFHHRKSKEHLGQIKAKNPISCPICFKTFDTLEKMIGHKDRHSLVQCDYCESKLKSINDLHLHVLNHACLKIDEKTGHNSWNCNACEIQFSKREEFFTHHKSAHPYSRSFRCPECFISIGMGRKTQWGIIQSHLAAHKRGYNGFYCFECGQLTKKYKEHQLTHIRPYMCDQCGLRFSAKDNMRVHNRIVHLKNAKNYPCEKCGKSFVNNSMRNHHLKEVHSKIEFTCDICGIKKNRKVNFVLHMASHQEKVQKPFVCGTCRNGFRLKFLLQRHELTHSGVKPFSCNVCSRAFNQIDSLKRHMRQHTGEEPYKCKDCGKGFKQTSSLKSHIHVHHNPDRKRCEICEKSFRNDVALKKHLEDHVQQGKNKKKAERKTKCSAKEEKKKRYCTRSTKK